MHFEFAGKKVRILALAVTVFMLIFVGANYDLYLDPELGISHGYALFMLSLFAAPTAGFLIVFKPSVDEKYKAFANTALFFLMPILSIQMVEIFNGNYIWNYSVKVFMANYFVYIAFFLFFYLITGRYHMTGLIVNIFLYIWSLVNYFVELFRGTPFVPLDLLTISTGLEVSDGYTYELSWQLILGSIMFFLIYLLNKKCVNVKPKKLKLRVINKCVTGGVLAVMLIIFFCTEIPVNAGFKPDFWNQARGYGKTGSFFNFCLNTRYLIVQKPTGYDTDTLEETVDSALEDYGVDPDSDVSTNILTGENDYTASDTTPNIIYIMNESFSDLSILGDLETNTEYLSFFNSLTENTIKGYVTVPVYGAGTSNSEYEALTGNSVSFLPSGSNAYQIYVDDEMPSLVSTLTSLGYSKTAYHPYYGSGWNRETVYPLLGFDDFISIEDFIDEDIINTYKENNLVSEYEALLEEAYPGEDILLRRFVSDSYDYSMIEEMSEERDEDEPFFVFNVTMQNHGGYTVSYSNFVQEVYITNLEGDYPKAERYLSLIKESDEAFEELIEYFSNVDEPTIICMFGDHMPSIETSFYEELLGSDIDNLTTEQEMLRYTTPFIIWANYDIDEAEVGTISSNYLSVLLSQAAGLPQTQYSKYLSVLYQSLPVITTVGYVDSDGNYYASDESSIYDDLINEYSCLSYNSLFGGDDTVTSLFYLDDEEEE